MRKAVREGKKTVIFIVGPTAVGKTRLSVKLAKALGGEIVSCDSMQVYKGMKILSQAPVPAERAKIRHHLVGVIDPSKEYSIAAFRDKASRLIDSIINRRKTPIVVGGSGLYMKALIDGLFPSPKADLKFRKRMADFAQKYGNRGLHKKLSSIDPDAAGKIHPNDVRRVIRALEIYNSTGKTMTELKRKTSGLAANYDIRVYGLIRPRQELYGRIGERVDAMFREGAVEEAGRLKGMSLSRTAKAVLGYKEIAGYLNGEYPLDAAIETVKRNTRRFAKRQLTWFRADRRIEWFDLGRLSEREIVGRIGERLETK